MTTEKEITKLRNFWIHALVDGRQSVVRGGPEATDGGFYQILMARQNAKGIVLLTIEGKSIVERGESLLQVKLRLTEKVIWVCEPCEPVMVAKFQR